MAASEHAIAQKIADSESIAPIIRADLIHGLAPIRACQKRFDDALGAIDTAEITYRAEGDQRRLAEAYAVRGYVLNEAGRFVEASPWHGKALTLALELQRAKPTEPADIAALGRVLESAHSNLAFAISESVGPGIACFDALSYIRDVHRLIQGRRSITIRHLIQWVEGKILWKMGLSRAARKFRLARRGFVHFGMHWEIALVSLDLAVVYRVAHRWEDLETLAEDTLGRFCSLSGDCEAIAALNLWAEAVEARRGIRALISAAQETIAARKARP